MSRRADDANYRGTTTMIAVSKWPVDAMAMMLVVPAAIPTTLHIDGVLIIAATLGDVGVHV